MKLKALVSVFAGLSLVAVATAQLNRTERNFQRLDVPKIKAAAPTKFWLVTGFYGFPEAVKSYGGSLVYTEVNPASTFQVFQSTISYKKLDPSPGTKSDVVSNTTCMQLTNNAMYAISPGWTYMYNSNGSEATIPFVSGTYNFFGNWGLTPTLTYEHVTVGGVANNGYVPDFMVIGTVPSLIDKQVMTLYADYTVATRDFGTGSVQLGGKHPLNSECTIGLKFAANFSKGAQPGFLAQLSFKF